MRLLVFLIFALPAFCQDQKLVSLSGVVVNSATGEPVKRALVQIMRNQRVYVTTDHPLSPPVSRTAFTDASGLFRFDAVPEGDYTCIAQKPEFVPDAERTAECKAPAQSLRLTLSPLGVITGRITDQDGLPLRAVNVYALSTHIEDGLRVTRTDRNVTTDDRGMYRLWNLAPGKYYIKASGFAATTATYIGDTSPAPNGESFPTTYFGGGKTRDSATPIDIKPGAEAVSDLTLNIERGFSIRGTLSNIAPRLPVKFELVTNDDPSPVRVLLNSETGKFEVTAVSPGTYVLRATQDKSIAELPLSMPASDLSGVNMALESPVSVAVNQHFTNAPPVKDYQGFSSPMPGGCTISLRSADGGQDSVYFSGRPVADVRPGRYRAVPQCYGAYVRSVLFGSQDLLANPELRVAPGTTTSIEITATHDVGTLTGDVVSSTATQVSLILIPRFAGDPVLMSVAPHEFQVPNLAPGTWTVYAFSDSKDIEFRNREFIRTLTGGVPVEIEAGKEAKISIPGVVR